MNVFVSIFLLFSSLLFSKEINYVFYGNKIIEKDSVKEYNNWRDQEVELQIKQLQRETKLLKVQGIKQDAELDIMYKNAEFYDYVATNKLKRDLIRAKIYYYYFGGYRRYYYFDYNWNVIYVN